MEKEEDGKTRGWGQLFHLKGKKKKWFIQKPTGSDYAQE